MLQRRGVEIIEEVVHIVRYSDILSGIRSDTGQALRLSVSLDRRFAFQTLSATYPVLVSPNSTVMPLLAWSIGVGIGTGTAKGSPGAAPTTLSSEVQKGIASL